MKSALNAKSAASVLSVCSLFCAFPSQASESHRAKTVGHDAVSIQTAAAAIADQPSLSTQVSGKSASNVWDYVRANYALEIDASQDALVTKFEKFYSKNQAHLKRVFRRASIYLPFVAAEVEKRGLPSELALLPILESGFNPRAYSKQGAAGLWQFMPATGREYGLHQDWWFEGRRDIVKSTRAALDHLHYLYLVFNDWELALAAYNAGEYKIKKAMQANARKKKDTSYRHLRLPTETRHYVPKLIALKNIVTSPARFRLALPDIPAEPVFEPVDFSHQVDLGIIARQTGVSLHDLKALNPALRRKTTPPHGPHTILAPVESVRQIVAWKQSTAPSAAIQSAEYIVQEGDTLSEIAQYYGMSVRALMSMNSLRSHLIRAGQTLRLPMFSNDAPEKLMANADTPDTELTYIVRGGDTLSAIAWQYGITTAQLKSMNSLGSDHLSIGQSLQIPAVTSQTADTASDIVPAEPGRIVHIVRPGESLWKIARHYNKRVSAIANWNDISKSSLIRSGQAIVIYTDDQTRLNPPPFAAF